MRNRGTWGLAFAGGLGGLVTWLVSEPFAGTAEKHGTHAGYMAFTLGSFYGWFAAYMLGALIAGFLSIVMSLPRAGFGRSLLGGLVAAMVGGALTCGIDALSDYLGIQFSKGPDGGLAAGLLVPMMWHLFVATTIALSVAITTHPTPQRIGRALKAGIGAAVASYFARDLLSTADAAQALAKIDFSKVDPKHPEALAASLDVWVPWSVNRLGYEVMMGVVIGLAIGFAETWSRAAWVRHELGRNEGRDYGLYGGPNRVGSAEGVEVPVRGDPAVAPVHAVVQPYQGHWMVSDVSGAGLSVNGYPTPTAYLNEGDLVQVGQSLLRFHLDGRKNVPAYHGPAAEYRPADVLPMPQAPAPVSAAPQRFDHRLVDPFGQVHSVPEGTSVMGRGADAQIRVTFDQTISRQHASLNVSGPELTLLPLAGRNGTEVNGQPVTSAVILKAGDQVKMGATVFTYRV